MILLNLYRTNRTHVKTLLLLVIWGAMGTTASFSDRGSDLRLLWSVSSVRHFSDSQRYMFTLAPSLQIAELAFKSLKFDFKVLIALVFFVFTFVCPRRMKRNKVGVVAFSIVCLRNSAQPRFTSRLQCYWFETWRVVEILLLFQIVNLYRLSKKVILSI